MHENIFDALSRCCSGPAAQVTSGADWVTLDYVGVSQCHTTGTVCLMYMWRHAMGALCHCRITPGIQVHQKCDIKPPQILFLMPQVHGISNNQNDGL